MDPGDGIDGTGTGSGRKGLDEALRVRRERSARFLARQVPPDARVVGLVYDTLGAGRTARATLELADALAIRRDHTLLAGMESGEDTLDGLLGALSRDGLVDVLRGRNRLTEVAIRDPGRPYVYLPAGRNAPPAPELVQLEAFRRFADRVRERGGTLLLHLPLDALPVASAAGLLDGYVSLGRVGEPPAEGREFGRVVFSEEDPPRAGRRRRVPGGAATAAEAAPGDAEPDPGETEAAEPGSDAPDAWAVAAAGETARTAAATVVADPPPAPPEARAAGPRPGAWARHRKSGRPPVTRIAAAAAVIVALALGWWLLSRALVSGGEGNGTGAGAAGGADASATPVAGAGDAGAAAGPAAAGRAPAPSASLAAAVDAAPELPYSVLIASYAARADATDRLARLSRATPAEAGGLFFLAPTPVRGAIYHRVFAGARPDSAAASRLMRRLVESGLKERTHPWDVRPVGLAFRLGVYGSREEAVAARGEAERAGIPAYLMPVPASGDTAFQLYAGAYESEAAARPMRALLELAQRGGELMARRGEPR